MGPFLLKTSPNIPNHRYFITIIYLWTTPTINPYFLWQCISIHKIKPALLKNSVSYVKEITLLTFIFAASFITWFTNIRPIPFPAYVCETTNDRTSARSSLTHVNQQLRRFPLFFHNIQTL